MLAALIAAVLLIGLAVAGIGIKMLFKPNHTFKKTCGSSFDPRTGKAMSCSCSTKEKEDCENVKLEVKLSNEMVS